MSVAVLKPGQVWYRSPDVEPAVDRGAITAALGPYIDRELERHCREGEYIDNNLVLLAEYVKRCLHPATDGNPLYRERQDDLIRSQSLRSVVQEVPRFFRGDRSIFTDYFRTCVQERILRSRIFDFDRSDLFGRFEGRCDRGHQSCRDDCPACRGVLLSFFLSGYIAEKPEGPVDLKWMTSTSFYYAEEEELMDVLPVIGACMREMMDDVKVEFVLEITDRESRLALYPDLYKRCVVFVSYADPGFDPKNETRLRRVYKKIAKRMGVNPTRFHNTDVDCLEDTTTTTTMFSMSAEKILEALNDDDDHSRGATDNVLVYLISDGQLDLKDAPKLGLKDVISGLARPC